VRSDRYEEVPGIGDGGRYLHAGDGAREEDQEYVGDAKDEKKTKKEDRFKALDKNNDGSIDLEEYKAGAKK
jgi:hypothetical protein